MKQFNIERERILEKIWVIGIVPFRILTPIHFSANAILNVRVELKI